MMLQFGEMSVSEKVERIDAHHHLWRYSAAEYGWIDEEMQRCAATFCPPT